MLADDFFMKKGIVFETMRRLAQRLEAEGIPYAVIGAWPWPHMDTSV